MEPNRVPLKVVKNNEEPVQKKKPIKQSYHVVFRKKADDTIASGKNYIATSPVAALTAWTKEFPNSIFIGCQVADKWG